MIIEYDVINKQVEYFDFSTAGGQKVFGISSACGGI